MSKKIKDLVISHTELGDLIVNDEALNFLKGFRKDLNVIGKIIRYAERVKKKDDYGLTRSELAKMINLKLSELEELSFPFYDFDSIAWITHQIKKNEKDVKKISLKKSLTYKDGRLKRQDLWHDVFIKRGKKIFSENPIHLNIRNEYLLIFSYSNDLKNNPHRIVVLCDEKKKDQIYEEVNKLLKKYNPLKGQICDMSANQLKILNKIDSKFTFDQLGITNEFRKELDFIINLAKNFEKFKEKEISVKRGILLYGIPGTGKTVSCKALINEFCKNGGTVFIFTTDSKVGYMNDYDLETVYKLANDYAPSLVVLEDFDLLASSRILNNKETSNKTVTNELLKLLEESISSQNVITIATTNIMSGLDEAAIRHGRIDRTFVFDYPNLELKKKILKEHLKYYQINNLNFEGVYNRMKKLIEADITGATIMSVVRSVKQISITELREPTYLDFEEVIKHIKFKESSNNIL